MPYGDPVYHKAVFDILHTAFTHGIQKAFLLNILNEYVPVFLIDDLLAVTDDILKEIIAALLEL